MDPSEAADAIAAKDKAITEKQRKQLEKATGLETVPFYSRGKSGFFLTAPNGLVTLTRHEGDVYRVRVDLFQRVLDKIEKAGIKLDKGVKAADVIAHTEAKGKLAKR